MVIFTCVEIELCGEDGGDALEKSGLVEDITFDVTGAQRQQSRRWQPTNAYATGGVDHPHSLYYQINAGCRHFQIDIEAGR